MSESEKPSAYFIPLGGERYQATQAVSGAWDETEQHISSPLGLMVHTVEKAAASRRDDPLQLCRLSFDILGTVPVGEVHVDVEVLRPGRTIELVEARMSHRGRTIVILRAWALAEFATEAIKARPFPAFRGGTTFHPGTPPRCGRVGSSPHSPATVIIMNRGVPAGGRPRHCAWSMAKRSAASRSSAHS